MLAVLQRLALAVAALHPGYRRAQTDSRLAWSLERNAHEALARSRLASLIGKFEASGLGDAGSFPSTRHRIGLEAMASLRVLDRGGLQALYPRLQELYSGRSGYSEDRSGGSTAEPTRFFRSATTQAANLAFNRQMLETLGWRPGMLRLCIWGSDRDLGKQRLGRGGLRQRLAGTLAFGGYSPSLAEYKAFVDAINVRRGSAVYGYTGLLEECARLMLEKNWHIEQGAVAALWSSAEMQLPTQRELIARAFGRAPRDMYGSRECPWLAAECEHGRRHISPRYVVESLDRRSHKRLPDGRDGCLAVSDLYNEATPFIRYLIGDDGSVEWCDCACGRRSFVLSMLLGRSCDSIHLPSGRFVSGVFFPQLVKEFPAIYRAQLVRRGPAAFQIRYSGEKLAADDEARLLQLVGARCEGATVEAEQTQALELTPQGKLRPYVDESLGV